MSSRILGLLAYALWRMAFRFHKPELRSKPRSISWLTALLLVMTGGCAANISGQSTKMAMTQDSSGPTMTLAAKTYLHMPSGLSVDPLPKGSTWMPRGYINAGHVYSRVDDVFVLDFGGYGDQFEAFLVVNRPNIVGVYFPYQQAFVRVDPPAQLNLEP